MSNAVLRKEIKGKLLRNGIILAVLITIFIGSYFYNSSNEDTVQSLNSKVTDLDSQISRKKNEYDQSEANLKEYLAIDKLKLPSDQGYSIGRDRLKVAFPIIQQMKDTYVFKKLNFNLSEIKENNTINSQVFTAYDNTMAIEFEGATDEYVYSFISDLKNTLPGYVYIKTIKMAKNQDITIASAVDYLNNGPAFVSGQMELVWSTLKLKNNSLPKNNVNNNNQRKLPVKR